MTPSPLRVALGATIRAERIRQGLTLREVAERAGVTYQYVAAVERALPAANPTLFTVERILAALGLALFVGHQLPPPAGKEREA